jgi:uncharacterized membrane protein
MVVTDESLRVGCGEKREKISNGRTSSMNTFSLLVGSTVSVLTFVLGLFVLFGYLLTPETSETARIAIGVLLMVFGIYRGGLLHSQWKQANAAKNGSTESVE